MYKQKELYKYCITAINCEFLKTYSVCLTEFKTVGILATSLSSTQKCKFFSFSLSVHAYFIIYFVDNCTVKTPIHAVFRSVKICVISLTVQQTYVFIIQCVTTVPGCYDKTQLFCVQNVVEWLLMVDS